MTEDLRPDVEHQHLQQLFDEATGKSTPPDQSQAILARVRRGSGAARARRSRWSRTQLAAAVIPLGLLTTVSVALMERERAPAPASMGPERAAPVIAVSPHVTPRTADAPAASDGAQNPEDAQHPKGTDPADLAAMRSAEAMLEAERRLAARLAAGELDSSEELLHFDRLADWEYTEGLIGAPPSVLSLSGQDVSLLGFMLPLDAVENMREFLLVDSLWSCCYGQPPNINGVVRCVMPEGETIDYDFDPVLVTGRFTVRATIEDDYCVDIYQLAVRRVDKIH